jgi:hypothetical protein
MLVCSQVVGAQSWCLHPAAAFFCHCQLRRSWNRCMCVLVLINKSISSGGLGISVCHYLLSRPPQAWHQCYWCRVCGLAYGTCMVAVHVLMRAVVLGAVPCKGCLSLLISTTPGLLVYIAVHNRCSGATAQYDLLLTCMLMFSSYQGNALGHTREWATPDSHAGWLYIMAVYHGDCHLPGMREAWCVLSTASGKLSECVE